MAGCVPEVVTPIHDRIWPKLVVVDGHWLFKGSIDNKGYGRIWCKERERPVMVHREVWEYIVGLIPPGLLLDHRCRVRHCCFPGHLEPVTNRENVRRGVCGLPKKLRHLEELLIAPTPLPVAA